MTVGNSAHPATAGLERASASARVFATTIPARLERLPWGRFHVLVIAALGVTWILDGLEVTLAGSISGALKLSPVLHMSDAQVGLAGSAYVLGAVIGALGFGWATDRLGRRRLFFVTIAVYLVATALSGAAWNATSFFALRFVTGAGIGGEYAAINSAIQELVPARYRGHIDLTINGSFWVGAALGSLVAVALLNPALFNPEIGWRCAFLFGAALGVVVFLMRRWIPESPRWLVIHGRPQEGAAVADEIEARFRAEGATLSAVPSSAAIRMRARDHSPIADVIQTMFGAMRARTLVGLALMTAQAFLYNAIFFTYALVLTRFYGVASDKIGWYILPFAASNFLGPLLLGRLFDTHGRRLMIGLTYALSGALLLLFGALFQRDLLTATTQTLGWMAVFFVASPAASSAYLTVSETFPIEIRALAIAVFYAIGTGVGGVAAPYVFGWLVESGSRDSVFLGYVFAAVLMLAAALIAALFAVPAERRPLEEVARPLSAIL